MDAATYEALLLALVGGCIKGMNDARQALDRAEPGRFPQVDDAIMFDAACVLAGTLIEASPEYADTKRLRKGADMAGDKILDEIRHARKQGDALGVKMLYQHVAAATGTGPIANEP